jgi:hypothetical protein
MLIHTVNDTSDATDSSDDSAFAVTTSEDDDTLTVLSPSLLAALGYKRGASSKLLSGYNTIEDSVYFRVFYECYDEATEAFCDSVDNIVGSAFLDSQELCRGNLLIIKVKSSAGLVEGESELETLLPYTINELVDTYLWRTYVGAIDNGVSSRMFRENMRRKELEVYMDVARRRTMEI